MRSQGLVDRTAGAPDSPKYFRKSLALCSRRASMLGWMSPRPRTLITKVLQSDFTNASECLRTSLPNLSFLTLTHDLAWLPGSIAFHLLCPVSFVLAVWSVVSAHAGSLGVSSARTSPLCSARYLSILPGLVSQPPIHLSSIQYSISFGLGGRPGRQLSAESRNPGRPGSQRPSTLRPPLSATCLTSGINSSPCFPPQFL